MIKIHGYSPAELERFRHYQSLSYDILDATAQSLQIGMSEHQATHAVNLGNNAMFEELDRHLPVLRDLIRNRINESGTFQKIAWEVDDYIRSHGYENCHRKHIGAVLGHLVTKADSKRLAGWSYRGLAVKQVSWFLARSRLARGRLRRLTPNWNHTSACKDVAPYGLWAVEPHLASAGVGVKFEEILIVDEDGARWLDEDLPHHRRWSAYDSAGATSRSIPK